MNRPFVFLPFSPAPRALQSAGGRFRLLKLGPVAIAYALLFLVLVPCLAVVWLCEFIGQKLWPFDEPREFAGFDRARDRAAAK